MCKSTVDTSTMECKCNEGVNPAAFAGYPICGPDSVCNALDSRIEGENFETSKGFCSVHVINTKTGTTRFFGVAYKERKADKGVMLNYCPFCGQKPGTFE